MGNHDLKRTPWFSALRHNPVRKGWYEMDIGAGTQMYYFDGMDWLNNFNKMPLFLYPGDKWRGLTEPAE